jgi:telomerase reverse transcriptase
MPRLLSMQRVAFDSDLDTSVCFSSSSHIFADDVDVFNRYPLKSTTSNPDAPKSPAKPDYSTIHVMMYIFPRQFGLHNVFTSEVDSQKTVQPFMDYTLREEEIGKKYPSHAPPKIPKRLRGKATELVRKMQILHSRSSYKELLEYYCPVGFLILGFDRD